MSRLPKLSQVQESSKLPALNRRQKSVPEEFLRAPAFQELSNLQSERSGFSGVYLMEYGTRGIGVLKSTSDPIGKLLCVKFFNETGLFPKLPTNLLSVAHPSFPKMITAIERLMSG